MAGERERITKTERDILREREREGEKGGTHCNRRKHIETN